MFGHALAAAADRSPDIVGITAAMESSTGLSEMAERHPDRVIDVGISEQHAVTMAAGLAMGGKKPFVAIYSSFLQRAFDQITLDVAMHNQPVTFVLDRAGVTGPDGASHHGVFDLTYLRMIPNMAIASPANEHELCALVATAAIHDGPMAIRYPKGSVQAMPEVPAEPLTVGEWEVLASGSDVVLFGGGRMAEVASKAAGQLSAFGRMFSEK